MPFLEILDYIGVFAFAVSGGLVAIRHKMDIFGVLVICLLPAIGGGTIRDLRLDARVFWLGRPSIVLTAFLGGISATIYRVWTKTRLLVWVDAMGLVLLAVVGCVKAFELGHGFLACIMMGVLTATAGCLLRGIVADEPPLLLKNRCLCDSINHWRYVFFAFFETRHRNKYCLTDSRHYNFHS